MSYASARSASLNAWPLDKVERLTKLVEAGFLGFSRLDKSKNAIAGKVYRMGLAGPKSHGPRVEPTTLVQRLDGINPFPAAGHCVFPIGHPRVAGFHFCGEKAEDGKPYCADHHTFCWRAGSDD